MSKSRGEISLGVGDTLYEGLWIIDLDAETITFTFATPIKGGTYDGQSIVTMSIRDTPKVSPYDFGAKIVNDIIKAQSSGK